MRGVEQYFWVVVFLEYLVVAVVGYQWFVVWVDIDYGDE